MDAIIQDLENEIRRIEIEVRKRKEESRTLLRECEVLDDEKYKYMDILDKAREKLATDK